MNLVVCYKMASTRFCGLYYETVLEPSHHLARSG